MNECTRHRACGPSDRQPRPLASNKIKIPMVALQLKKNMLIADTSLLPSPPSSSVGSFWRKERKWPAEFTFTVMEATASGYIHLTLLAGPRWTTPPLLLLLLFLACDDERCEVDTFGLRDKVRPSDGWVDAKPKKPNELIYHGTNDQTATRETSAAINRVSSSFLSYAIRSSPFESINYV